MCYKTVYCDTLLTLPSPPWVSRIIWMAPYFTLFSIIAVLCILNLTVNPSLYLILIWISGEFFFFEKKLFCLKWDAAEWHKEDLN